MKSLTPNEQAGTLKLANAGSDVRLLTIDPNQPPSVVDELNLSYQVISTLSEFVDAIYKFRDNNPANIKIVYLNPTQEWCLRKEAAVGLYDKNDQPLKPEDLGPLESLMGYTLRVRSSDDD